LADNRLGPISSHSTRVHAVGRWVQACSALTALGAEMPYLSQEQRDAAEVRAQAVKSYAVNAVDLSMSIG
jgi:hypothetical protein